MHYMDGREVKLGDLVHKIANEKYTETSTQNELLGTVVGGTPQSGGCNLQVDILAERNIGPLGTTPWRRVNYGTQCLTASECLRVEVGAPEPAAVAA